MCTRNIHQVCVAFVLVAGLVMAPPNTLRSAGIIAKTGLGLRSMIAPGDLDSTFGNAGIVLASASEGAMDSGVNIAVQPDGKIVAVGVTFHNIENRNIGIIRMNTDGSLDNSFGTAGRVIVDFNGQSDLVRTVHVLTDGKIIVAGSTGSADLTSMALALARLNVDGSLDATFGNGGKVITSVGSSSHIFGLTLQPDEKIVVAGDARPGTEYDFVIARYNTNGSLDTSFGTGGISTTDTGAREEFDGVAVLPDGKIIAVGYRRLSPTPPDAVIYRYHANGTVDTSFADNGRRIIDVAGGDDILRDVAFDDHGRIVACGFSRVNGVFRYSLFRLLPGGDLDASFGTNGAVTTELGGVSISNSVLIQSDQKIILTGTSALARYLENGALDGTFGSGGIVTSPSGGDGRGALDASERILFIGSIRTDGNDDFLVSRYLNDPLTPSPYAPFDFDGDGKTDVSVFRPAGGEWWYRTTSNGGHGAAVFGTGTDVIAPADYTGDGKTDMAFFRPSTGEWFFLRSEDFSFYSFPFGGNGDIPAPADYDGDGKADAAVYRPSTGTWYVFRSSDGQVSITGFGVAGDQPIPADYDGDGMADIGIFRPNGTNGAEWWILRSTAGLLAVQFGGSDAKAVPGDYTGDGKSDVAFFSTTGEWFILRSEDLSFYSFPFGVGSDLPVPGDYDGDGRIDAAVFRNSSATWFMQGSTSGTLITAFGVPGDRPVPNAFVR